MFLCVHFWHVFCVSVSGLVGCQRCWATHCADRPTTPGTHFVLPYIPCLQSFFVRSLLLMSWRFYCRLVFPVLVFLFLVWITCCHHCSWISLWLYWSAVCFSSPLQFDPHCQSLLLHHRGSTTPDHSVFCIYFMFNKHPIWLHLLLDPVVISLEITIWPRWIQRVLWAERHFGQQQRLYGTPRGSDHGDGLNGSGFGSTGCRVVCPVPATEDRGS